jgi:hypothetical protein
VPDVLAKMFTRLPLEMAVVAAEFENNSAIPKFIVTLAFACKREDKITADARTGLIFMGFLYGCCVVVLLN